MNPSRGNCAEPYDPRTIVTADPHEPDPHGGGRSSPAAPYHEVAFEVLRHELPYLLRLALRSSLVQPLEHKMVCRFLSGHLSAFAAAVGGAAVLDFRLGPGVYGSPVCSHPAARPGGVSVFTAVGQPTRRI